MTDRTKQQVADEVTSLLGVPRSVLRAGSTILKDFFRDVTTALGLELDESMTMPEMGRAIVESAGLAWSRECWSRGSTVTLEGLERILQAVRLHPGARGAGGVAPEVLDARLAVARIAGKGAGQRYRQSAAERRALEDYSMGQAKRYYESQGYEWDDVHKERSYDLHVTRGDDEIHVEVKGTTTHGGEVILTPGEVAHAAEAYPDTALFVLHDIDLTTTEDGEIRVAGGAPRVCRPWLPTEERLRPLGFEYSVPEC